jgi:UDP-N-acetyl-D-galactosamine dehydrogenase
VVIFESTVYPGATEEVCVCRFWSRCPGVDPLEAEREYGVKPLKRPEQGIYDAIVLAVAHQEFREMGTDGIRAFGKKASVLYDVKHMLPVSEVDGRL